MDILFIVEKYNDKSSQVFVDFIDSVISSIKYNNFEYIQLENNILDSIYIPEYIDINRPIFAFGSVSFVRKIKDKYNKGIYPLYYSLYNTNFMDMASNIKRKYLLNNNYTLTTLEEFLFNKEEYFSKTNSLFIRPNSSLKQFAGRVIRQDDLVDFIYEDKKLNIILHKPLRSITHEIRVWIINKNIVEHTYYIHKESIYPFPKDFINKIINLYNPDLAYVLDIAIYLNRPKVLEYNSISCSGNYNLSMNNILYKLNKEIINDYKNNLTVS